MQTAILFSDDPCKEGSHLIMDSHIIQGMRIKFVYYRDDDPAKSTMKKLERLGLASMIRENQVGASLTLSAFSKRYLLRPDSRLIARFGLCVLDGSWNRPEHLSSHFRNERRLPRLLAANPVNYGKIDILSSAEAIAAALYIAGYTAESSNLLSKFKWGPNFLVLNREPLDEYASAASEVEIEAIVNSYF